jgi:cyclomaltodextrinase / maltogenic alpha-amylase / neopullulanase
MSAETWSHSGAPAWVRDAVFYQVFPDRFAASARVPKPGPMERWDAPPTAHGFKGGDLLGIVERLDELADLGVTALYLTPVFASASNHRYHTYDYLAVDPLLGGTPALRELVDALHGRGMRIVLDGVFNHTGRGFWPFHHVVENGLGSPYAEWFHLDRERLAAGHGLQPYPERSARLSDHAADPEAHRRGVASQRQLGYRAWWDLPALPKLNTDHPPVREFLWSVAEHWLLFGIDGWRLDVPAEIDAPAFWQEFRRRCRAVNPEAYLVGEIWDVAPEWLAGDRFDALMNYPLLEAVLSFIAGPSLDRRLVGEHHELGRHVTPTGAAGFAQRLVDLLGAYPPATVAVQLNLLSSHDMPRFRSLVSGDAAAVRLAWLLQMSLPGAPCIYYGDEVGMEGGNDPDCRRAFPTGATGRDEELRTTLRGLVAARRAHPALRSDRVVVVAADGLALLVERGGPGDPTARGETLLVALNAGTEVAVVTLPATDGEPPRAIPIPGLATPVASRAPDGPWHLELPPRSGSILEGAGPARDA